MRQVPWHELPAEVRKVAHELTPFHHRSSMPFQINFRPRDGAWYLALYNPWGARRGNIMGQGALLDEGCRQTDRMHAARGAIASCDVVYRWPVSTSAQLVDGQVEASVGPGGVLICQVALTPG